MAVIREWRRSDNEHNAERLSSAVLCGLPGPGP
jgi:hypothetical protein